MEINIRILKSFFHRSLVGSTTVWVPSFSSIGLALLLFAATITISFSQVVNPSLIASIYDGAGPEPRLYNPNSVFVQGKYAYIIGGSNALEIVDKIGRAHV